MVGREPSDKSISAEYEGRGTYVLLIKLPEAQTLPIGSLPDVHFHHGYSAYVGSARGGIKSRLSHHLKRKKKPHWHSDYLLPEATITNIIIGETEDRVEHAIARALSSHLDSIPGFGSSDCPCRSHLFFANSERKMKSTVMAALELLAIPPKLMGVRSH